jgi:ATP-dependent DNA ligase
MQCKSVTPLPSGEKWTLEIKFDGHRCVAVKREREVTLFSRHKKALNKRFPGVVDASRLARE